MPKYIHTFNVDTAKELYEKNLLDHQRKIFNGYLQNISNACSNGEKDIIIYYPLEQHLRMLQELGFSCKKQKNVVNNAAYKIYGWASNENN